MASPKGSKNQRNIGLLTVLKWWISNSESFNLFLRGLRHLWYRLIGSDQSWVDDIEARLQRSYFRTFANILADITILIATILVAINYKLLLALIAGALIVNPPLLIIALSMLAVGMLVRSMTSIIYNLNKESPNKLAVLGNVFVLAAVGLLVAGIIFPPLMPLLLPLALSSSLVGGSVLSISGKEMSPTNWVGLGLIVATVGLIVATIFFPPLLPTLFIIAAATSLAGGSCLYTGNKTIDPDSILLNIVSKGAIAAGVILILMSIAFPPAMPFLFLAAGFVSTMGYLGVFRTEVDKQNTTPVVQQTSQESYPKLQEALPTANPSDTSNSSLSSSNSSVKDMDETRLSNASTVVVSPQGKPAQYSLSDSRSNSDDEDYVGGRSRTTSLCSNDSNEFVGSEDLENDSRPSSRSSSRSSSLSN